MKNEWTEVKFGDLFKIKHGYAFKGEYFSHDGHYILLTPGNFKEEGGFRLKGEKEKYYTGDIPPEYILKREDLLVVMTEQKEGLLGSSAIIPGDDKYLHNQRLGLIINIDATKINKKFLYFLFNYNKIRAQISATANGAKVRHTSPARIYEVKAIIPELEIQNKIITLLTSYDYLIENNYHRIEILEQIAKIMYNEWFVKFKFPGCEHSKMIDSELGEIPEGWQVLKISDIVQNVKDNIFAEKLSKDLCYLPIDLIPRKSMLLQDVAPLEDAQSSLTLFRKGDIVFGSMRTYFHKVIIAPFDGVTRKTCFTLRNKAKNLWSFSYLTLFQDTTVEYANMHSNGATIPYAIWENGLANLKIVVPPNEILDKFEELVSPILKNIMATFFKNRNLAITRDRLLPKLISGALDVSHLDIKIQEE